MRKHRAAIYANPEAHEAYTNNRREERRRQRSAARDHEMAESD